MVVDVIYLGNRKNQSLDSRINMESVSAMAEEANSEPNVDSEEEFELGSDRMSSLTVCMKVMGRKGTILLAIAAGATTAWQLVMALFLGGAFFRAIEASRALRGWAGLNIAICLSTVAPTAQFLVEATYDALADADADADADAGADAGAGADAVVEAEGGESDVLASWGEAV
jgi:hypothetical protein